MSIVRRPVKLISAGLNEAAADLGGMLPGESLILKNAYFDTPSTASVRAGSVDGDELQDDGVPAAITSIPFHKYFPSQGGIFVIGHSTVTSKHYIYQTDSIGENLAGGGSPIAPVIIPTTGGFTYNVADPVRIPGDAWYNRKFYFADIEGLKGMVRYNGDTGVADYPLFELGGGPAAPLRPRKLFNHKNHMVALAYGDENTPYVPDLLRVYRVLAPLSEYPLHLGLTESGMARQGTVASAVGIGILLAEGIGDTIRVSLTPMPGGDRREEVLVARQLLQSLGLRSFEPQVAACPGCGRTTSTFFQEMAQDIEGWIRERMPAWKESHPGVEELSVAGCVVNGPGESRHADIGISLPGSFEEPSAPVYVDGEHYSTLRGDDIVPQFISILEDYVERRFGAG